MVIRYPSPRLQRFPWKVIPGETSIKRIVVESLMMSAGFPVKGEGYS